MRPYRAPNKRLIPRSRGGRFRRSTLADVGLAACERCGRVFAPAIPGGDGGPVDPREVRQALRFCGDCLEEVGIGKSEGRNPNDERSTNPEPLTTDH